MKTKQLRDKYEMIKILAQIDRSEIEQALHDFWEEYYKKYNLKIKV